MFVARLCNAYRATHSSPITNQRRWCLIPIRYLTQEQLTTLGEQLFGPLYVGSVGTAEYEGHWCSCLRLGSAYGPDMKPEDFAALVEEANLLSIQLFPPSTHPIKDLALALLLPTMGV